MAKNIAIISSFPKSCKPCNDLETHTIALLLHKTRRLPLWEVLSRMSHRYAIGITEYLSRSGQSEAERYRLFRDIEFDTEEFHALVRHCNKTITTSHDTATATLSSEAVHTNGPHPRTAAASGRTRRHPVPEQSSPKTW